MNKLAQSFRDLDVYRLSFDLQQSIFTLSKAWPAVERYALTDQVRRSSRSVGANLAEAWARRRYPAHFLSKLTDADGELQETLHWLDTAAACGYVPDLQNETILQAAGTVGRSLGAMIRSRCEFGR